MAKYKYASIDEGTNEWWVFFSDNTKVPSVIRHDTRQKFKEYELALEFALKWVVPIKSQINKLTKDPGQFTKRVKIIKEYGKRGLIK